MKVPKTQLAVKLIQPGKPPVLEVQEVPVMKPGYNQVLVKIEYSPIHPGDISTIYGKYGGKRSLPFTPGIEGSGRVVKAGGGVRSWMMKGQKVGLIGPQTGIEGTWQQYVVCNAFNMVGIKESISFQQASLLAANPSTAIAAFHTLKKKGIRSIAQNAAAGAMGKILFKYLTEKGINVVNIVRTQEQENIMKESGAKWILNQTSPSYKEDLTKLCQELNVQAAFDVIGGSDLVTLCDCLPQKSSIYIYGNLSNTPTALNTNKIIFNGQKIYGFWAINWIKQQPFYMKLHMAQQVQQYAGNIFGTSVSKIVSMNEVLQGVEYYRKNMSKGKVLVNMNDGEVTKQSTVIAKLQLSKQQSLNYNTIKPFVHQSMPNTFILANFSLISNLQFNKQYLTQYLLICFLMLNNTTQFFKFEVANFKFKRDFIQRQDKSQVCKLDITVKKLEVYATLQDLKLYIPSSSLYHSSLVKDSTCKFQRSLKQNDSILLKISNKKDFKSASSLQRTGNSNDSNNYTIDSCLSLRHQQNLLIQLGFAQLGFNSIYKLEMLKLVTQIKNARSVSQLNEQNQSTVCRNSLSSDRQNGNQIKMNELISLLLHLSKLAGEKIIQIYDSGKLDAYMKHYDDPCTRADIEAQNLIAQGLVKI